MMSDTLIGLLPLLAGWLLDLVLGDPSWLPHPVVGFGKLIAFCEHRFNRGRHRKLKGAFVAVGLIAGVFILTSSILHPTSYIFHLPSSIFHHPSYILHLTSYILHLTSYILHLTSYQPC